MKGLNSGTMPSQADLAKGGKKAGTDARPAKRAKRVMPIIGESRIRRSVRARAGSSRLSRAYFKASAPPLEKPTRCSGMSGCRRRLASRTASRVPAIQSSQVTLVSAAGTVPWAGMRRPMATKPCSA
ncbi:hypothetical protein D9M70_614140 [compost metagenome]